MTSSCSDNLKYVISLITERQGTDGQTDREGDRKTDGRTDVWTDRHLNKWTNKHIAE